MMEVTKLPTEETATITFEKVNKSNNRRIMINSELIAHSNTGVKIYQSSNRNVLTIEYQDYYYHIELQNLVDGVLK